MAHGREVHPDNILREYPWHSGPRCSILPTGQVFEEEADWAEHAKEFDQPLQEQEPK